MPSERSRRWLAVVLLLVIGFVAAGVSVPIAEQRALDAEDEYVAAQLESEPCLTDWGTREGAATQRLEATGVGTDGIRVEVALPYAYTTERNGETIYADSKSEAVYDVSLLGTHRVRGDEIAPC